jgi:hypothetical protein
LPLALIDFFLGEYGYVVYEPVCDTEDLFYVPVMVVVDVKAQVVEVVPLCVFDRADVLYVSDA